MPREKEGFHDQLDAIYERFGKEPALISIEQAASYVGMDKRTLLEDRSFPVKTVGRYYKVSLIGLARWLA